MKLEDGREATPIYEFKFRDYNSSTFTVDDTPSMVYLTCKNHPTALYSSKNPHQRNLHILKFPNGSPDGECACPFSDLVVLAEGQEK